MEELRATDTRRQVQAERGRRSRVGGGVARDKVQSYELR